MKNYSRLWKVLCGIFAIIFASSILGTCVADSEASAINIYFNCKSYETKDVGSSFDDTNYFTNTFSNGATLAQSDLDLIEEIEGEGATLLWNNDGALPFDKTAKITLLGNASVNLAETGTGSGWIAPDSTYSATLKSAFTQLGVEVNPTVWNFYVSGEGKKYKRTDRQSACKENAKLAVNEVPWSIYTTAVKDSFAAYGDVAVVVLTRSGGEYSDLHVNGVDTENGNYLTLTQEERDLLTNVGIYKRAGVFGKVVLLINSGNAMQFDGILAQKDVIDACLWIGECGMSGANAVAKLLVGDINPSGRLTDTYCYFNESAPATLNDGDYKYGNLSSYNLTERQSEYMVYQEGIYVGYHYYETRYEDCVTQSGYASDPVGASNASAAKWSYGDEVAFPFGYGLSYTDFAYEDFTVSRIAGGNYEITVKVTNVGDCVGKHTVELYLQKPYAQKYGVETAAVQLVGYAKTENLAVGESQTVKISVDGEQLKTYDSVYQKTYVTEKGNCYFALGKNAHDAVNNVLAAKGYLPQTTPEMDGVGDIGLVYLVQQRSDTLTYSKTSQTDYAVSNRFDSADVNTSQSLSGQNVTYLSRSNWKDTYPLEAVQLNMTDALCAELAYDKAVASTDDEMPTYGEDNNLSAVMFRKIGYDENIDAWNNLLDEMTWEEQALLCANAYHRTQSAVSIALPASYETNGPSGVCNRSDFSVERETDYVYVSYPCAPIVASTWNADLVERLGNHIGQDALYVGYSGIYCPGLNVHRTAFGGRNWEYFSEDAFLAGKTGAAEVKGIESEGCMAFVKHFALNDLETNRRHVCIWSNEQATRENYLLAFEICLTEGGASGCMNSFTRVGATWCGASYALLTTIVRDEWGWTGIMISDWDTKATMSKIDGLMAGTDAFDGSNTESVFEEYRDNPAVCMRLREATKRIVFNVVRSSAMNGIGSNTKIVSVLTWWQKTLIAVDTVTGIFAVGFAILSIVCIAQDKREASINTNNIERT